MLSGGSSPTAATPGTSLRTAAAAFEFPTATKEASGKKLPRLPPKRCRTLERASAAPCGGGEEEKATTSWRGVEEEEAQEDENEEEGDKEEELLRLCCKESRRDARARGDQAEPLRIGPHRASVVAAIVTTSGEEEELEASERSLRPTEWLLLIFF